MAMSSATAGRERLFRQMDWHNRLIDVLRLAVPLFGLISGGLFLAYFTLANRDDGVGFEALTLDGGRLVVNKPRYSGVLENGGTYRVNAETAVGRDGAFSLIDLTLLDGVIERPGSPNVRLQAAEATLDSTAQTLRVPDLLRVDEADGARSRFTRALLSFDDNSLVSEGAVHIEFADGQTLDAASGRYDGQARVWTFEAARLILPGGAPGTSEAKQ